MLCSGCDTLIAQAITGDNDDVLAIPASFLEDKTFTARDAHLALA